MNHFNIFQLFYPLSCYPPFTPSPFPSLIHSLIHSHTHTLSLSLSAVLAGATNFLVYKQVHRGLVVVQDPSDPPVRDELLLSVAVCDNNDGEWVTLWCRAASM